MLFAVSEGCFNRLLLKASGMREKDFPLFLLYIYRYTTTRRGRVCVCAFARESRVWQNAFSGYDAAQVRELCVCVCAAGERERMPWKFDLVQAHTIGRALHSISYIYIRAQHVQI